MYSNFLFLDRFLFELSCKNTHTQTRTHTHTQRDSNEYPIVATIIIRENYVEEFFIQNGLLNQKHQETKTGQSFNQLVIPKGLQKQVMSVNHESAFIGNLGTKKTEVRILPNFIWPGLTSDIIRF